MSTIVLNKLVMCGTVPTCFIQSQRFGNDTISIRVLAISHTKSSINFVASCIVYMFQECCLYYRAVSPYHLLGW